jgi:hypothetical protein
MAQESKKEQQVREAIEVHLEPGETLRHFTWGGTKSTSAAWFLFGIIGAALAKRGQKSFFVGLTDRRLVLVEVQGQTPADEVQSIPLEDVKGLEYKRGLYSGSLNIHLSADKMALHFDSRPWFPRAQQMAKMLPLSR